MPPLTYKDLPPLTVLSAEEELIAWAALEQVLSGREVLKETLQRPSYKRIREELRARLSETVAMRLNCLREQPPTLDVRQPIEPQLKAGAILPPLPHIECIRTKQPCNDPQCPIRPCPECQKLIDDLADGHPNPEGLLEWYDAGHHICGADDQPKKLGGK